VIVVDSSVWIDYFNGRDNRQADYLHQRLGSEPVAIGDLILTEVLQGFRDERSYRAAHALLTALTIHDMLGRERVVRAAERYRSLKRAGTTVRKTADVIIGSFCIDAGLPLLFNDRDFLPMVEHLGLKSALARSIQH